MKKNLFWLGLCISVSLLLVSCTPVAVQPSQTTSAPPSSSPSTPAPQPSPSSPVPAAPKFNFKVGIGAPSTNPVSVTAEEYSAALAKATDGQVVIDVFAGEALGTDKQMAEACSMGTLDMSINAQGILANYEPKMALIELPFLFNSTEKVGALLDSEIGEELAADLPKQGIRVLAYWENGLRHIANNKRAIESPSDMVGLKFRTPENNMTIAIFKALGASPSPFAFGELYLALQQGMFDGQENAVINMNASKFYEVQDYLTITYHKYESRPYIISEKIWKTVPGELQETIKKLCIEYAQVHRDKVSAETNKILDAFENQYNMKISRPDLKPFRDATASIYKEYEGKFGKELIDKLLEAVK